jgi:flagellar biosynthesis protein FliQ
MPYSVVVDLARQAILTAVLLAAPMLVASLVVGLVVSIVQALTQVQEQTLTFVPKLLAVAVVFLITLPWLLQVLVRYAAELFRGIPGLVS